MRSLSEAAKAGFDVEPGLDVQVLRQWRGPKFTLQFECDYVSFKARTDFQAVAKDAGLESVKRFGQLAFKFAHVWGHHAEKVPSPKVDDRFQRLRKILDAESLLPF